MIQSIEGKDSLEISKYYNCDTYRYHLVVIVLDYILLC